jgi:hypothetical protein
MVGDHDLSERVFSPQDDVAPLLAFSREPSLCKAAIQAGRRAPVVCSHGDNFGIEVIFRNRKTILL